MKGYIGSVRFFKNLILLIIIILIAVPTVFSIRYHGKIKDLRAELTEQEQQVQKQQPAELLEEQTEQVQKKQHHPFLLLQLHMKHR